MGFVTGIIVFLLIWWTALFLVLPFGHERDEAGKPVFARMKKKFLWTSVFTVILWGLVFVLIESDVISFRDMANQMIEEDHHR
jgi:predicted secreted protein